MAEYKVVFGENVEDRMVNMVAMGVEIVGQGGLVLRHHQGPYNLDIAAITHLIRSTPTSCRRVCRVCGLGLGQFHIR
jgi:multisubunit Na+/H+ antiporter MnhF subunit